MDSDDNIQRRSGAGGRKGKGKQKGKGRKQSHSSRQDSGPQPYVKQEYVKEEPMDSQDDSTFVAEDEIPSVFSNASVPMHNNKPLSWDYKVNLIGEKALDVMFHFCDICKLPIFVYGRLMTCKHVFCLKCAKEQEILCPQCHEPFVKIERNEMGTVFQCPIQDCKRTYLSERDLQAHHNHRHMKKAKKEDR